MPLATYFMVADPSSLRRAAGFAALIAAVGVVGTASLAALVVPARRARPVEAPRSVEAPRAPVEAALAFPTSAAELRETLAARTRLRPDRRALMALAELQRLVDGTAPRVDARWRNGRWQVLLGGTAVGVLPEHADFDDLVALVSDVAAGLTPLHPLSTAAAPPALAAWPALAPSRPALATLSALDAAWSSGHRSRDTLATAARALTALAVETPDALDGADLVTARALAALAWTRSLGQRDLASEALLARHMGYDEAARRASEALPAASPVRAWARRDDDALRPAALDRGASETARYLWFRRLVERHEGDAASAWAERSLRDASDAVAVAGFLREASRGGPAGSCRAVTRPQPQRLLHALEREASADAAPVRAPAEVLPRLASLSLRRAADGAFVDRALVTARDRAVVLSALYDDLACALDAGAATDAAQVADTLGALAPEALRDFVLWATHVAYERAGTLAPDVLMQDLAAPLNLGAALLLRACDVALRPVDRDDPRAHSAVERLAAHLDARPAHRAALALRAGDALHDIALAEALCAATLRDAPSTDAAAWCLARRSDGPALLAMARDATLARDQRARAAGLAEPLEPAAVGDVWRALAEAAPRAWEPTGGYARWLAANRRAEEALALVRRWLRDAPAALLPSARVELARTLRARGDAQGALRAVEPSLASLDAGLLAEAALSLADLGRFDDAERVALASLEHHRAPRSVALAAEVQWRRNAYDRAARTVAQSGVALSDDDWRALLADAFARVFVSAAPDGARAAVGSLVGAAVPRARLRALPRELHRRGRSDLAVVTLDALTEPTHRRDPDEDAAAAVEAYTYRRALDPGAALTWARAKLEATPDAAAPYAFSQGADELLWAVVAPSREPEAAARLWLLRAAASVRAGARDPHRDALVEHYRAARGDTALLGRALLGAAPAATALAVARAPRRRAEVAWYAGLRAQASGRALEALDWYALASLVGAADDREAQWAREARDVWYARARPLAHLGEHPWTASSAPPAEAAPVQLDAAPEAPAAAEPPAPRGRHRGHHRARTPRAPHHHHGRTRHP